MSASPQVEASGPAVEPAAIEPAAPPAAAQGVTVEVQRWERGHTVLASDQVAQEAPVAILYEGVPHVVMLASPADLIDYAYGFTVSEELVATPAEIRSVEVRAAQEATEVHVSIAWERFPELLRRRRNLTGRTGCGLCGAETLPEAIRGRARIGTGPRVSAAELHRAIDELGSRQPLNARTGSVHAAAWVIPGEGIYCVREDVGRHNALDKAIGALLRAGLDLDRGYMLVTSRASYEMVQKAATVGIAMLAALSAPTSLAIRHAERSGLTLVAFARRDRHVVYAHPQRLAP